SDLAATDFGMAWLSGIERDFVLTRSSENANNSGMAPLSGKARGFVRTRYSGNVGGGGVAPVPGTAMGASGFTIGAGTVATAGWMTGDGFGRGGDTGGS